MRPAIVAAALLAAGAAAVLALQRGANGEPPAPAAAPPAARAPAGADLLADERNTIGVFGRVSDSVVYVTNTELRRDLFSFNVMEIPRGTGSGFVWDRDGHVVTNFHVVQGGDSFSVTLADGSRRPAELVGVEPNKDLAVLRIDADGAAPIPVGDSKTLVVGQKVLAIGNPFGLDQTLTTGVISALGREIPSVTGTTIRDVIQTDASINPGNSGGPLLDSSGRLIGVNTAIFSPTGSSAGIGFAVPVATVRRIVPQLIRFGKVRRAGLGVRILPDHIAQRWGVEGVVIAEVDAQGAAARAGLRGLALDRFGNVTGFDAIVGIDDAEVADYDDLYTALDRHRAGDEVTVRYRRGRADREARLELQELE